MAQYTPKTWVTGETITAAELNALEQAAASALTVADAGTAGTPTGNALRAAYVSVFTPEAYGAVGDGSTNDTVAVQAALTAACAVNGSVYLSRNYAIPSGGLTANARIKIFGSGAFDGNVHASAALLCSSTTATVLTISADGCVLEDFAVINTATSDPTAGSGIKVTAGWWSHMTRVGVSGFWVDVEYAGACYYTVTDCKFIDPVHYGVFMHDDANQDYGEVQFHGNTITLWKTSRTPTAAVHWESGGGLKFINNKINGGLQPAPGNAAAGFFDRGFQILIKDGLTTVDCLIEGNSIENCSSWGVEIGQLGPLFTGNFHNVVVTGNEFGYSNGDGGGVTISAHDTNGHIGNVVVSNNVFASIISMSVRAQYVDGLHIGPNRHLDCCLDNSAVVWLGYGCYDVSMEPQNIAGDSKTLFTDATALESANAGTLNNPAQAIDHTYTREIPPTPSSSDYVTLYRVTIPTYTGGILELVIGGGVANKGSMALRTVQAFNREMDAITLTPVGTVTATGIPFDYLLDTSTTWGEIQVKVRLNAAAGGTNLAGRCQLRLSGWIQEVRKGA